MRLPISPRPHGKGAHFIRAPGGARHEKCAENVLVLLVLVVVTATATAGVLIVMVVAASTLLVIVI